ncbi:MAG TPA: methyl-accepting chemotaxis protein [Clostridia bacterium]|nr:methyl-accepting chemotaxis protein [Clostridia bacterium]
MSSDKSVLNNYSNALSKFVVGYNKSVMMHTITQRSMDIMGSRITGVQDSLGDVVATFEEIQATSKNVSGNTEEISNKMESLVANNNSLDEDLRQRTQEIEAMRTDSGKLNTVFKDLFEKSKEIQQLTGAIQDVSDRTNVLSINASIEAARAGEAGRGFRVIAGEVKNLSHQTSEFAETIEQRVEQFHSTVEDVAAYIQKFTELMQSFSEDISAIREGFNRSKEEGDMVGNALKEIAGASTEESYAIKMGLDSLENTFNSLKDASVLIQSLQDTYTGLSDLLDNEQ